MPFKQIDDDAEAAKRNSKESADDAPPAPRVSPYVWPDERDGAESVRPGRSNRGLSEFMRR